MDELYIKTSNDWRKWLKKNHNQSNGVWLVFFKKETGKPCLDYEASVEEALCFGWIDSLVKKIDDERYVRKFTPRNDKSIWSELNKRRVKKVIKEGRMTSFGLSKVNAAKKSGIWKKKIKLPEISDDIPKDFIVSLRKNESAKVNFKKLSPSHKKRYYLWINQAKKKDTGIKRINESGKLLSKNLKLGLK
ncbi:MAG: YdeI/OmpD-associated family protein [Ignavibacteriaceae bacterium]|nr:YdeI/OmpD-associated family protein [Ignavibacteriaceae bacterium]